MEISTSPSTLGVPFRDNNESQRQETSKNLEIAFVTEMLSFVGMKELSSEFGGGAGEEQFQSFLREQHARLIVDKGGLGLAEQFFNSMAEK
ncbi:rod-binding protein [Litoreibacter halocynthiae]|uniref:rod-binding protein n=1 Tax=Litoreibacter halocynthiae TaxID=1242689 RepID=UPI002490CE7A|nr:rod-binding protein [Litoreibacter halocynthiae]